MECGCWLAVINVKFFRFVLDGYWAKRTDRYVKCHLRAYALHITSYLKFVSLRSRIHGLIPILKIYLEDAYGRNLKRNEEIILGDQKLIKIQFQVPAHFCTVFELCSLPTNTQEDHAKSRWVTEQVTIGDDVLLLASLLCFLGRPV